MGFASAAVEATKVSIAKVQKERAETLKYSKVRVSYLFYITYFYFHLFYSKVNISIKYL